MAGLFKRVFSFGQGEEKNPEETSSPPLTPFEQYQRENAGKSQPIERFPKSGNRFLDKKRGENDKIERFPESEAPILGTEQREKTQELERLTEPREGNNALDETANLIDKPRSSWLERLTHGLARSSERLASLFTKRKLDEESLTELEDVLLSADFGLEVTGRIIDKLRDNRYGKDITAQEIRSLMGQEITQLLEPVAKPLELDLSKKPHVILMVGVNGSGKTTTIGKLAAKLHAAGLKVMLAAGDTFRAAAIEQLHIWGERIDVPVVASKLGSDAASLAYDAYLKAKQTDVDILIIDTAGRLQNKTELMEELAKIVRVLAKHDADAPHTVLQTLDATTGQNGLTQVDIFRNIAGVNGLVMTKLDGTARGGILVAIAAKHQLPVYFIGVGEGVDDLEPFTAQDFCQAILGKETFTEKQH